MNRLAVLVVLLGLVVAGSVAGVPASDVGPADGSTPTDNGSATSGEHLSGALSAHEESVSRNLSRRTLAVRVDSAPDDVSRARALAGECDRLEARMQSIQRRVGRLERAHENGSLSRGEFRAKMTGLEAEARTVADLAEECAKRGQRLPDDVANATDVNASAYSRISMEVGTFSRQELAEHTFDVTGNATSLAWYAREVVTNESLANASDEQLEAIAEVEAQLSFHERQRDDAAAYVNETAPDDDDAREALACADDALEAARTDLERARTAAGEGDDTTFENRMADARAHLDTVEECVERVYEEVGP